MAKKYAEIKKRLGETVEAYANIKLARARHKIEKRSCDVYHLFVKMPRPRDG
jgi:hypothetical protein